jgi:hypothetical protein
VSLISFSKICNSYISNIQTDSLHSYKKLAKEMESITISYSESGSSMEQIHKQIMLLKDWLRRTHHKCSKEKLFAHADEYKYRFNRRNMRKWLFNDIINKMMNQFQHPITIEKHFAFILPNSIILFDEGSFNHFFTELIIS